MGVLSIRNMNFTLQVMEQIRDEQNAAWYASLSDEEKADKSHYWHLQRKAKRGKNKWIFVRDLYMTKKEAAEYWRKFFSGRKDYRLRHQYAY